MELEYITVNGRTSTAYENRKRLTALKGHMAQLGSWAVQTAENGLHELITPVALEYADHKNGSHLRDQYFENKRQARIGDVVMRYGL